MGAAESVAMDFTIPIYTLVSNVCLKQAYNLLRIREKEMEDDGRLVPKFHPQFQRIALAKG